MPVPHLNLPVRAAERNTAHIVGAREAPAAWLAHTTRQLCAFVCVRGVGEEGGRWAGAHMRCSMLNVMESTGDVSQSSDHTTSNLESAAVPRSSQTRSVLSRLAVAIMRDAFAPVARPRPPRSAVARCLPEVAAAVTSPDTHATHVTGRVCSNRRDNGLPVSTSHTTRLLSRQLDTSRMPSVGEPDATAT